MVLAASMGSTILCTNILEDFYTKERLTRNQSLERAMQSQKDKYALAEVPWDQIRELSFGIGREIAYEQFGRNRE